MVMILRHRTLLMSLTGENTVAFLTALRGHRRVPIGVVSVLSVWLAGGACPCGRATFAPVVTVWLVALPCSPASGHSTQQLTSHFNVFDRILPSLSLALLCSADWVQIDTALHPDFRR